VRVVSVYVVLCIFLKKTKFQLFRDFIPAIKSCYSYVEVVVSSFRIQLLTCSVRSPSQCSFRCVSTKERDSVMGLATEN
jgi:hypothetical protein